MWKCGISSPPPKKKNTENQSYSHMMQPFKNNDVESGHLLLIIMKTAYLYTYIFKLWAWNKIERFLTTQIIRIFEKKNNLGHGAFLAFPEGL